MFDYIRSFFSVNKKKLSVKDVIDTITSGQVIKIIFKDPNKLGLIDPSKTLTARYDPEDLEKRIIIGTLLTKRVVNDILFLEIGCFKMRNGMRVERTYTLMLEEVEHVEEVK